MSETVRPIYELFQGHPTGPDLLFMGPTDLCTCGNDLFHALIWFDVDRTIGGYFTEMVCALCGALVRGVTEDPDEVVYS